MTQQITVYLLRVSVAVPHLGGKPEFSEAEIVNRVDAALRYVPGNCDVEAVPNPELVTVHSPFGKFVGIMK